MSESKTVDVVAHWHKLIENFQTSPKDFYTTVELGLDARSIPGLKVARVKWSEGGVLSPDREYLRVSGDRHIMDLCAAPFGTGFFFSSWTVTRRARFVPLYLMLVAFASFVLWAFLQWMFALAWPQVGGAAGALLRLVLTSPFVLGPAGFIVALGMVSLLARMGYVDFELAMLAVPIVGAIYRGLFAPDTYYRLDTLLMLRAAVHSAMMEAIDGLTTQKGLRALTDDERKPVFNKLM